MGVDGTKPDCPRGRRRGVLEWQRPNGTFETACRLLEWWASCRAMGIVSDKVNICQPPELGAHSVWSGYNGALMLKDALGRCRTHCRTGREWIISSLVNALRVWLSGRGRGTPLRSGKLVLSKHLPNGRTGLAAWPSEEQCPFPLKINDWHSFPGPCPADIWCFILARE